MGADWVFLLNNDTVVSPTILDRFYRAIELKTHSILGVVINDYSNRSEIQTEGVRYNPSYSIGFFDSIPTPVASGIAPKITDVDIVNGCAVLISKQVFDAIGKIDERFFLICEESDFCLRAQEHAFKLGVIHESHVWHKHSVSFVRAGKSLQRYYGTRNLRLLLKKHPGGKGKRAVEISVCLLAILLSRFLF